MSSKVLIIDDEEDICTLLQLAMLRMGLQSDIAYSIKDAMALLRANHYDFCLTDLNLPDGNGLQIVRHLSQGDSNTPVAVISAYGSMDTAIEAMQAGAFDFVNKPIEISKLKDLVSNALKTAAAEKETAQTPANQVLLGSSKQAQQLRTTIEKLAKSQAPIYLQGESGTGKEVAARLLHQLGPRKDGPFIAVNCGAIPSELMESEFFGHKKGSFTGATQDKAGLFETATGGTLFLDEVADLPMHMQVKLLRVIQEKAVRPVGATQEVTINVRLVSATHKNLAEQVASNKFRQDLFYRINVIELNLPPLRERSEDIGLLAVHFLQKIAKEWALTPAPTLSEQALNALAQYHFAGNVRELQNILERAVSLCEGEAIEPQHLRLTEPTTHSLAHSPTPSAVTIAATHSAVTIDAINDEHNLDELLKDIEKSLISQALHKTHGNRTAAAKVLGIGFRALRYKLEKLGFDKGEAD